MLYLVTGPNGVYAVEHNGDIPTSELEMIDQGEQDIIRFDKGRFERAIVDFDKEGTTVLADWETIPPGQFS